MAEDGPRAASHRQSPGTAAAQCHVLGPQPPDRSGREARTVSTGGPSGRGVCAVQWPCCHVVLMRYEEDGTQIDRLLLEDVDVDEYIARKDAALAMATPYQEDRARLDG